MAAYGLINFLLQRTAARINSLIRKDAAAASATWHSRCTKGATPIDRR
jgi:hypothetical protein